MTTPDPLLVHEALDRLHVVLCMIDDHLLGHPFIESRQDIREKIAYASKSLSDAYQLVGSVEMP